MTVEEHGYVPRTGWSDGFPRDALVCFRAYDYRHIPTHAPKPKPRRDPEPTDLSATRARADMEAAK